MTSTIAKFPRGSQADPSIVTPPETSASSHTECPVAPTVPQQGVLSDLAGRTRSMLQQIQAAQSARCRQWNADHQHQVEAGKARAQQFTHESQSRAAFARNEQLFARFRAEQGLPPLSAEAVQKYVTPAMIRSICGLPIPSELQQQIHRAWCAGCPYGVAKWLNDPTFGPYIEEWLAREGAGWVQPALLSAPIDENAPALLSRLATWPSAWSYAQEGERPEQQEQQEQQEQEQVERAASKDHEDDEEQGEGRTC